MKGHSKRSLKVALSPAKTTWPQHSVCTCQSFHMLNSQSRIVEGQACQTKRWCPLWFGHFLQTPSSFKNANYLDWSDIWKMFLQPKELGDTAMGLHYSERQPCSLTVWQRWNEAAGLSIFIYYLWGSGRFCLKHIQTYPNHFPLQCFFIEPPCDCCGQSQKRWWLLFSRRISNKGQNHSQVSILMFVSFKPADTSVLHSDIIMVMFFSHLLPDIKRETLESGKRVRLGRNHGALVARLFVKQLQRLGTLVLWYVY